MLVKSLMKHITLVFVTAVVVALCTVFAARHVLYADLLAERYLIRAERALLSREVADVRAERESLRQERDRLIEALEDVAVPPNNDKLFTILSMGVGVSELAIRTDSATTTVEAMFTTDLTAAQQTNASTQEFLIQNTDATNAICFRPIAWTIAGATCDAKCATQTITCSAANTDGIRLAAGQSYVGRWDGTACGCVVSNVVGGVAYQTARIIR